MNKVSNLLSVSMKALMVLLVSMSFGLTSAKADFEDCIDLNNATKEELMEIKWIDDVRSDAIMEMIQEEGFEFKTIDDLEEVKGIGPVYLQEIKDDKDVCVVGSEDRVEVDPELLVEEDESETEAVGNETSNDGNEDEEELLVPETSTNMYNAMLIGAVVFLVGVFGAIFYKKRSVQE